MSNLQTLCPLWSFGDDRLGKITTKIAQYICCCIVCGVSLKRVVIRLCHFYVFPKERFQGEILCGVLKKVSFVSDTLGGMCGRCCHILRFCQPVSCQSLLSSCSDTLSGTCDNVVDKVILLLPFCLCQK